MPSRLSYMTKTKKSIVSTPEPPYYTVIFTSILRGEVEGYNDMAVEMNELAAQQPGFLGVEIAREGPLYGMTISYWKDEESILAWKNNAEHQWAQKLGREKWYQSYSLRIAKVERAYSGGSKSG